jgi:hypothetical protein
MTGRAWWLSAVFAGCAMAQQVTQLRATFEVRYVATGAVYLAGGREEGLQEGFRLTVKRIKPGEATLAANSVAELVVTAVAAHSAVCNIESSTVELQAGDVAQISAGDLEALQAIQQSKTARRYAQVVTFTEGDPLEQEQHDHVPRPPSPAVNRVRGRLSYEFNSINDHEAHLQTFQNGMSVRVDATRLGGTFWNFTGYWRGRFTSSSGSTQVVTLNDLLNRTYTIGFYYSSPQSPNSIGVGRLYLPWATSLGTIDGGYFARRVGRRANIGFFGGSTPDPTAWDYKPNRQIAGVFTSLELGRFENTRFTATAGLAVTRLSWKAERQFAFTESMFSWKQRVSVYHNLEADQLVLGRLGNTESGAVVSRSFLTTRIQPWRWLAIDVSHNYFRTVPTFDLVLVGTGVLDRFLFDGLSGGLRLELPGQVSLYGSLGQSKRNDDPRGSLNQMYGIAVRNFLGTGFRADARHSVFHGAFGNGWYQSVSVSRDVGERIRFELIGGQQEFRSPFTSSVRGFFVNSNLDWFLNRHYVLGGGINLFRGQQQNYDQTFFTLGYRL